MTDAVLAAIGVVFVGVVAFALWQNGRDRARLRRTQAGYDAATTEGQAALRESLSNQRRMVALFEEMNATLKRIEAGSGGRGP